MDFNLSSALEKRLKVLPNKATIGVQVTMQDSLKRSSRSHLKKNSLPVNLFLSSTSTHKDAKTETELIQSPTQEQNKDPKIKQSPKYRLKGVLAEENSEIHTIDKTNRFLRVELLKARKKLLRKM